MVLIETPMASLLYQFAGTPDRVYSPAPVEIIPVEFIEEPHGYRLNGREYISITQILKMVGIIDFSRVAPEDLKKAATFGKAVHSACHFADEDDLVYDDLDEPLRPYLDAWGEAKERERFEDDNTIVEIKSSVIIEPWVGLQLAAQQILAGLPTCRRVAIQLKPNGKYQPHDFRDRADRASFLAANSTAQWILKNGGRKHDATS